MEDSLIALCQRLNTAKESSCAGSGHGVLLWSKLRILAEPLMSLSNPLPIDLLPLIDAVREAPIVSMDAPAGGILCEYDSSFSCRLNIISLIYSDHATFTEKWLSFLDRHPAVKAYTDPVFVFVLPAPLVADPGLAGTVALFPPLSGGMLTNFFTRTKCKLELFLILEEHHFQEYTLFLIKQVLISWHMASGPTMRLLQAQLILAELVLLNI